MSRWRAAIPGPTTRLASALLLLVALLAGCSRDGFEDRTAVVAAGDRTIRFTVDSCGLDDATLFVVGRSDAGEILQAVIELDDDGTTANAAATGFTAEVGPETYAAFGEVAWDRRNGPGEAPGSVSSGYRRGARIKVAGRAESVDADGRVSTGAAASEVDMSLDARCDERDR